MDIKETFLTSIGALRTNLMRTLLTTVGVVIGVLAVILLVAIGKGVNNFITDQFNAIGSNLILVAPGRINIGRDPSIAFTNNKLTIDDVDDINTQASEYIVGASPNIRLSKTVQYKSKQYSARLIGASERVFDLTNFGLSEGKEFTKNDVDSKAKVALIGPQVKKSLFDNESPLGKTIKIAGVNFVVIGVVKPLGGEFDQRIILPYTSIQTYLDVKQLSGITIKAKSTVTLEEAERVIMSIMLANHKRDEFGIATQQEILSTFQNILMTLSIGLGAIAGISLLVGGIGVMNIMLVSVAERTNEIGLRKALGATPKNIAQQFIFESSLLSIFGGVLGISLAFFIVNAIQGLIRAQVTPWSVVISFGFSVLVGIIFGTYPALKAAHKNPVEALGYEL